jgi:putative N6-adenine-specific DNA methylase
MRELFVTCPRGFEELLQNELETLGVSNVFQAFCGVFVPQTIENVFLINYESRIATRVLWPIAEFYCRGKDDLYSNCRNIPWSNYLSCNKTFSIDANVQHETLKHSLYASLVVKDAICDFFREKTGARPSIDKHFPDVQLNLFIQKGRATIYLDTSGAPLHKRGWRSTNTEATLHESLAAGLLLFTGYNADKVFCDPFCGSGTFLVEAALIATKTPPGFFRKKWGFFHLPNVNKNEFLAWKEKRDLRRIPLAKGKIFGSDKSREASEICKKHIQKALPECASLIEVNYSEIAYYNPKEKADFIVTNPPYGKRLETSVKLFQDFRSFVKQKAAPEAKAFFLCPEEDGEEDILKESGLETEEKICFKNGGLTVTLLSLL